MCQNKTKEEMRDQAIGLLEEARDGLDAVLSQVDHDQEMWSTDSRITDAMELIDQAKETAHKLTKQMRVLSGSENRKLKNNLDIVYCILVRIFEPNSGPKIESAISEVQEAMDNLKNCKFPVKV